MTFSLMPSGFDQLKIIPSDLLAVSFLALLFSLIFLYSSGRDEVAFRLARSRTGCFRVPRYPHTDRIWGRDLVVLRQKAMADGRLFPQYHELFRQLGKTWEESFYKERIVNTMDMANIKYVAALESENFTRIPSRMDASRPLLGTGIFNSIGPRWRHAREMLKPAFTRTEVGNIGMMNKHIDRFLSLIPRDGSTLNAQPLLRQLFLDIGTEYLFGESTDSLLPESSFDATEFLKNLDAALAGLQKRRSAGMMHFKFYFDRTWPEQIRKVHAFIDSRVSDALQLTNEAGNENRETQKRLPSISDRHILLHEMARQIRDPIELRYQILNIFLPGRDVTASVVSNALFHLARHPSEWEHLRAQPHPETEITFEAIKSMTPFLDVIHETLRLTSPGGRSSKWASKDSILPTGGGPDGTKPVFIPKGTAICLFTASLHRDPEIWGPDADNFRPSRFRRRLKAWEYLPFFGGPGICPAQQLALVQATYVLYKLVCRFKSIENRDPTYEFIEQTRMSVESRNGSKIAFN